MKKIKHYKIVEKLGSGGMGEVYKAYDSILERDVAIKVMHRHLLHDKTSDTRFMREARIVAKSVHPNIVTIYEVGKAEFGRYIVMEFVKGTSLTKLLSDDGAFEPGSAVKLTIQILSGLQYAHSIGILHRDIKSENILVSANDHVKILDFGIAKSIGKEGLTIAGELLGTVEYMAPEQMLGEAIDHRSDIYAVGVVLYQILTNKLPFESESAAAILYKQLNEEPLSPSYYNDKIDKKLDQVVVKAIEKNKEERWQTAEAFAQELEAILKSDKPPASSVESDELHYLYGVSRENGEEEETEPNEFRTVFIGREKEFKKLVNVLSQVSRGQGQTVILKGEAGVGKSTLAERFRNYAEIQQAKVLYGSCLYQEGMNAYLPYIDALRQFFSKDSLPEEERVKLKGIVREKVPILMEFTEHFTTSFGPKIPASDTSDDTNNANLFEGIYKLIAILSTTCPILLIIDDLQWADEASLRLFHYMSRYVGGNRVLLLGITRTDRYDLQKNGKPGMLIDVLGRIRREVNLEEIKLDRLNRESCDLLMDKSLGSALFTEEFYESIYAETKGNPFFVTETLKLLRDNGGIYFKEGAWYNKKEGLELVVPRRVEDVFFRRLSALNDEEHEILQAAAVQGYRFEASMVSQLLEIPKIKLLKILQRVERELQIITSTEKGFQFEHPMLRDLLYNEIPVALRCEYHLMIVSEFEKIHGQDFGALVGEVAQHYRCGGEHVKAIPLLYQAGVRAFGLSAYREASLCFEDMMDSVDRSGQPIPESISQSDLYLKFGTCYEESSRWQQGLDAYEKLLEITEKDSQPKGQTDALLRIGRIYTKLGAWKLALSNYERCLEIAKQHAVPNVESRVYNNIGVIYREKGDFAQALQHFEQTLQTADCEHGKLDKAHALMNIGIIANIRSEHDRALESYQEALDIYERNGNRQFVARIQHNIGMTLADKDECDEAITAFERCLKLADEIEDKRLYAQTYLNMGRTFVRQKKLSKAKKYAEKALKIFKRTGDTLNMAEAYHVFGLIHGEKKEYSASEKFLMESIRLNKQLEHQEGLAETYVSYGDVCLNQENIGRARKYYKKALKVYEKLNLHMKIGQLKKTVDELTRKSEMEVERIQITK